jgi:hypothetical protein
MVCLLNELPDYTLRDTLRGEHRRSRTEDRQKTERRGDMNELQLQACNYFRLINRGRHARSRIPSRIPPAG